MGTLDRFKDNRLDYSKLGVKDSSILPSRSVLRDTDVVKPFTREEMKLREKARLKILDDMLKEEEIEDEQI
jgi:hypothetical protein